MWTTVKLSGLNVIKGCELNDYDEAIEIYNVLIEYLETRGVINFEKLYKLFKYKAEIYDEMYHSYKPYAVQKNAEIALFYLYKHIESDKNKSLKNFFLAHDYEELSELYTILERTEEADEAMAKSKEYKRI